MSTTIIMPQLGESVAEGVIGKWLKNEGDSIEKDEPIVEVITDKVNAEIPSPVAGTLEKIVQPEGATVAVGQPIGVIGDGSGSAPEESQAASTTGNGSQRTSPGGDGGASMGLPSAAAQMPSATSSAIAERSASNDGRSERVRSSPLVRRLAEEHDINLADVPGT
jgi:pyruvate/2-oxoglutarate dehydrogenase complex dihydrolipoamide acyltransferase (E2) component